MRTGDEDWLTLCRDFQHIFATPNGRRVWGYIRNELCRYDSQTPNGPSGLNAEAALYYNGRRDVAAAIEQILRFDLVKGNRVTVHRTDPTRIKAPA